MVILETVQADTPLLQVGHARNALGSFLRLPQRWKEHRKQDGDDSDHDQQLNERKAFLSSRPVAGPARLAGGGVEGEQLDQREWIDVSASRHFRRTLSLARK
jgi:hypothetical protein